MTPSDYIYRFDPQNPAARPRPHDPQSARQLLEEGNRQFSEWMQGCRAGKAVERVITCGSVEVGREHGDAAPRHAPLAVIVGCCDARVPAELVFGQGFNSLFVVRVIGNALGDVPLASVEYAVTALESVQLVVVLGHSSCGAVTGAVDSYLNPDKYWAHSPVLRDALQRFLVAVRAAARGLGEVWGSGAADARGYREALIDSAIAINAAQAAYELRKMVDRAGKPRIDVVYGVHNICTHVVSAPTAFDAGTSSTPALALAPADPLEFQTLAVQLAQRLRK
jgi:carbonic anhydrase